MKITIVAITALIVAAAPFAVAQEETSTPAPAPSPEATASEKTATSDPSVSVTTEKDGFTRAQIGEFARGHQSFFSRGDQEQPRRNPGDKCNARRRHADKKIHPRSHHPRHRGQMGSVRDEARSLGRPGVSRR